jgi:hypothetical protein
MPLDFQTAERLFRENKIRTLAQTLDGLLYLKLRSLSRKQYLERLVDRVDLTLQSRHAKQIFRDVYEAKVDMGTVDDLIQEIYWTSIIIEDIFRDHPSVLPAVGQVKKIDFFIRDVPYDLKVTYLPEGYIAEKRKILGLRPEITVLKALARQLQIHYEQGVSRTRLLEDLWAKLADHPSQQARQGLKEIKDARDKILQDAVLAPSSLIKWLYEQQGARRFDAANRLFLILVDKSDYFGSWKLKRAKPLLVDRVNTYLDNIDTSPGQIIEFQWTDGQVYQVLSDVIFVVRANTR